MTPESLHLDRIREAATRLELAEENVRILRALAWDPRVKEHFFSEGCRELPHVVYPAFDPGPVLDACRDVRRLVDGAAPEQRWLQRQAHAIERGAQLLATLGTHDFLAWSRELFRDPTTSLVDGMGTPLDLARLLDRTLAEAERFDLGAATELESVEAVAEVLRRETRERFGDLAPEVLIVDDLSANALAGVRAIRLRRDARFTERDVHQLLHHEAFVHVCTGLNGREQPDLPILRSSHPGTTCTQEGLAVFAEFMSGTMDVDRLRRLSDRVLAIQMALDGADFLEVFRHLRERVGPDSAFETARRVFRGGLLTGGAPFTKDVVYLEGLLRVHDFLRVAVSAGRADCITVLFCGKLDLDDVPALCRLAEVGLCRAPRFLPPWVADRRFLVAYLAYASFLNRVSFPAVRAHYQAILLDAPRAFATPPA